MMGIWAAVGGESVICRLEADLYRIVESQQQSATLNLSSSLAAQEALEEILEESKPPYPATATGLHYLISTPFRYPPLKWGSRFGDVLHRGIFYGALKPETTLSESAYYRFCFYEAVDAPHSNGGFETNHLLFSVKIATKKGVFLDKSPFDSYSDRLLSKTNYSETQRLGADMRKSMVQAFTYKSSRDLDGGICGGVFDASAIQSKQPNYEYELKCVLRKDRVIFLSSCARIKKEFLRKDYLVDGALPVPA